MGKLLFFGNLLITFRHYYYAKYMFLTSLIWLIFSDFRYIGNILIHRLRFYENFNIFLNVFNRSSCRKF